jgi:hypothetical protein
VKFKSDINNIKLLTLLNAYRHNAPSLLESVKLIQNMVMEADGRLWNSLFILCYVISVCLKRGSPRKSTT